MHTARIGRRPPDRGVGIDRTLTTESQNLIDLGHRLVPQLVRRSDRDAILGVAVSGSAARGDAGPSSDLDLMVIMADGTGDERRLTVEGRTVSLVGCAPDYPAPLLRAGAPILWVLRENARLRAAIPIYDPMGIVGETQRRAAGLQPSRAMRAHWLDQAGERADIAAAEISANPASAAMGLRAASMLALLPAMHDPALPPHLYYSKPKYEVAFIDRLPVQSHRMIYNDLHERDRADARAFDRQRNAVEEMRSALLHGYTRNFMDDPTIAIADRVTAFITDSEDVAATGQWDRAAPPLRYAAYELGWLAASRAGTPYTWSPDALPTMNRLQLDRPFLAAQMITDPSPTRLRRQAVNLAAVIRAEWQKLTDET